MTRALVCAHRLTKFTGVHRSPSTHTDAQKYVCSHGNTFTAMRHTAFQYSSIPRIVYIVSLSPTGHTSRLRCVTALSHSPPSKQACIKIPSYRRGTRILQNHHTAAGFDTPSPAHNCAQVRQCVFSYNSPQLSPQHKLLKTPSYIPYILSVETKSSVPQTHLGTQLQLLLRTHRGSDVDVFTCLHTTRSHANCKHLDSLTCIRSYLRSHIHKPRKRWHGIPARAEGQALTWILAITPTESQFQHPPTHIQIISPILHRPLGAIHPRPQYPVCLGW